MELSKIKKVYFTGIKGVGMTAMACIAKDYGMEILGSDVDLPFVTDEILGNKKISWEVGFDPQRVRQFSPDLLIYTVAHRGENNLEVIEAKKLNIPVFSLAQGLGMFSKLKKTIAVAGVGGKSTTTALISTILEKSGHNPSYMIGAGTITGVECPGKYNKLGDWFVIEADDYKSDISDNHPKFYYLNPQIVIITNLVYDHPDVYQNEQETLTAFKNLIEKIPTKGALIINVGSKFCQELLKISNIRAKIYKYGIKSGDYKISEIYNDNSFKLESNDLNEVFKAGIFGQHNILNCVASILTCIHIGISLENIKSALSDFKGIKRRMELIYKANSSYVFDDYAHHPDEIRNSIESLKKQFPDKKIIVIFQPHTYSRTKALYDEFKVCFEKAFQVFIADIFASARELADSSISSKQLVQDISNTKAEYFSNKESLLIKLKDMDLSNTILVTMGAGDIYEMLPDIISILKNKTNMHI